MNNEQKENIFFEEENANNKVNKFNLIIGISTFLIAILGATFAYFSATTRDSNSISVRSAFISISYDGGTEILANNLIPSTQHVALEEYQKEQTMNGEDMSDVEEEDNPYLNYDVYQSNNYNMDRKCVDARGKEVCYVYQFTINSDSEATEDTDIVGYVSVGMNEFENLSYILYEVDLETEIGENGKPKFLKDKYGFNIVKEKGYNILETNQYLTNVDTSEDNPFYQDGVLQNEFYRYGKFEAPTQKINEDGTLENFLISPAACLFGYSENYKEYEMNDPQRCRPLTLKANDTKSHHYQLVIWLQETGEVQNEQARMFIGNIVLEVRGGNSETSYSNGKITGILDGN